MALNKVKTKYGIAVGVPGDDSQITVFKGIPFAKPPVGELRFAPPQEPEPWEGELICDQWPKACIQLRRKRPQGAPPRNNRPWEVEPDESEDCLYLNIWTPAETAGEKLPVMFWIYGGGFSGGWGANPEFRGEAMCKRGVVLVTINYRCGALGFLSLSELSARSPRNASGNYGILDQIMALKWVRESITEFGGDPENITVFGQSAGGMSARYLLCSPLSRGLIKRAIIQSGGGITAADTVRQKEEIGNVAQECLKRLGWTYKDLLTREAKEVNQTMVDIADDVLKGKEFFFFQPCIDGYSLTELPEKSVYNGNLAGVDIICGTVAGDSWMFSRKIRDLISDNNQALRAFGYSPGVGWARHQVNTGRKPIRTYYFEHSIPAGDEEGSPHGCEKAYIFGTLKTHPKAWTEMDYLLSKAMTEYWTNFAKTGNPNGNELPEWPVFTAEKPFTMNFTDNEFSARDLVDNAIADRIINYTIEHPGMIDSLKGF